ncbi:MAG TPA: hypothetical protein VHR66_18480 [Gemmataceae bacterium]|nr:hypothetical protein [Gemmataceae bacterium]
MDTTFKRHTLTTRLRCEQLEHRDTPAAVTVINYADGFAGGNPFPGIPIGYNSPDLLLTDGPFQARAAWAANQVHVGAFETSFVFRVEGEPGRLGDGFTFAFNGDRNHLWMPGTAGAGVGYQGLTDSVAIKFDLVDNAGEGGHSVSSSSRSPASAATSPRPKRCIARRTTRIPPGPPAAASGRAW